MARNATSENIDALRDVLTPYVEAITTTLIQVMAQMRLDVYLDAVAAYMNVSASAAGSYSSAVGQSVQKRQVDEAKGQMDSAWGEFVRACGLGGQTVPSMDDSIAFWDMGT